MDTQRPKEEKCSKCGGSMKNDETGRSNCPTCNKNTQPKDLYEERLFDLKDYQK